MRSRVPQAGSGGRCPPWSRPGDAARLFARGITVRPCVPVAAGHAGWLTCVQVGLNFVAPFLVASYGYLTAAQVPMGEGAGYEW